MRRFVKKHIAGRDTIIAKATMHHPVFTPQVARIALGDPPPPHFFFQCLVAFQYQKTDFLALGWTEVSRGKMVVVFTSRQWRKVTSENCEAAVRRTVRRLHWKRPTVPTRPTPGCRYTRAIPPSTGACSTRCSDRSTWCQSDSRPRTDCMYSPELSGRQRH